MPIDAELLQVVDISVFDVVALIVVFVFVLISTTSLICWGVGITIFVVIMVVRLFIGVCVERTGCLGLYRDGCLVFARGIC